MAALVLAALAVVAAGLVLVGTDRASGDAAASGSRPAGVLGGAGIPGLRHDHGRFGRGLGLAGGTLTAIDASSLTVRVRDGRTVKVATTSSTAYYRDTTKVARSELKVGDLVAVHLADPLASSPTAGAVRVVLPSVVGTVSAVREGSFTLTDRVGFRHVVKTGSSTTYAKDGQSSSRSAVVTDGAVVRAVGTIDANGTDLTATRVEGFTANRRHPGFGPKGFGVP